jgi:hypothetical protein
VKSQYSGYDVHQQSNRHARATDLAKNGFTEMELRIIIGRKPSSQMPVVYLHLSGSAIENKVLQKAGLIINDSLSEKNQAALTDTAAKMIEMMQQPVINNPQQLLEWAQNKAML